MERGIERGLGRLLAPDRAEALADVLERERVVSDERAVVVDEPQRGLRRLVVALDRRPLAVPGHALVRERDVHDVRVVGGLARDDERLCELQSDDPGFDLHDSNLLGRARDRDDVRDDVRLLLPGDDPGGHDAAALLNGGGDLDRVEPGLEERRPHATALASVAVTACAVALEDRLAAVEVAGRSSSRRGCRRREDLRLRERERRDRDGAADQDRPPATAHQNPNLTVVKYQRLEVTQRATSIEASVRPAVGSAQRGSEWSRTMSTFAANTP